MSRVLSLVVNNHLLFSILGFLLGVFVSSFIHVDFTVLILVLLIVISAFAYLQRASDVDFTKVAVSVFLFVALFSLGILRYNIKNNIAPDSNFALSVGQVISIDSIVISEPRSRENYREYLILAPGGEEKVLVRSEQYPEFKYGDEVVFRGKLTKPENFETDLWRAFDYVSYLRKDNVKYILSYAKGEHVSSGNGGAIKSALFRVKNDFLQNINNSIREPESSLLAGVLLGVDSMGKEIEEAFRRTGIVHIVVLSGYNITIVAESIMDFFAFLPKNFAIGSGAFGIILFAIMVGGTPSVLRASLMALLVLLARATGRAYDITRALLIAGFLMVLWNPNILVFDTSFQLSFLSTLALIWISPIMEKKLTWIPEKFGFREITSATISTQIFVLPLLLFKMGQFSMVGIPVNLLVLGFIPMIMFFGFLTGLFGFVSSWLALPFAFISQILLTYVLKIVWLFNLFPFASIQIPYFSVILFWLMYILYGYLFWKLKTKN